MERYNEFQNHDFRKVDSTISSAVDRPEVIRAAIALRAMKHWDEVVGAAMAERSWPDRYDGNVLWVACTGSAWAQELRMMRETILVKLAAMCDGSKIISDVRFGVRPLKNKPQSRKEQVDFVAVNTGLSIREIAEQRLKHWPK